MPQVRGACSCPGCLVLQGLQLKRHIDATLGSGNYLEAVKLPPGEDLNEWLAVNTVDFYNAISILYATLDEFCTERTCEVMCAGPKVCSAPACMHASPWRPWMDTSARGRRLLARACCRLRGCQCTQPSSTATSLHAPWQQQGAAARSAYGCRRHSSPIAPWLCACGPLRAVRVPVGGRRQGQKARAPVSAGVRQQAL